MNGNRLHAGVKGELRLQFGRSQISNANCTIIGAADRLFTIRSHRRAVNVACVVQ